MIISPNMGLNIPEGNDVFDYKKYLKENLEKIDENFMNIPVSEELIATEGQTVFNLANSYTLGANTISVEVDGVPQELGEGFTESSSTSITLSEGVPAGAVVSVNVFKTPVGINSKLAELTDIVKLVKGDTLAQIQSFFDSVPNNSKIKFPEKTYTFDNVLVISNKENLSIDYSKATFNTIKHGYGLVEYKQCTNIQHYGGEFIGAGNFYSNTFDGSGNLVNEKYLYGNNWGSYRNGQVTDTPYNNGHLGNSGLGVFVHDGCDNITIEKAITHGFNYAGICVGFTGDGNDVDHPINYCSNVIIKNCESYGNFDCGIQVKGVNGFWVHQNYIHDNGHPNATSNDTLVDPGYGITLRNGKWVAENGIVSENICFDNKRKGIDSHGGKDFKVINNQVKGSFYAGIMITDYIGQPLGEHVIEGNEVWDCANGNHVFNEAIHSDGPNTSIIRNNLIKNCGYNPAHTATALRTNSGIYADRGIKIIENNTIIKSGYKNGILVGNADEVYINNNKILNDNCEMAIRVRPDDASSIAYVEIVGNSVKASATGSGIVVQNGTSGRVSKNNFRLQGSYEPLLAVSSPNLIVEADNTGTPMTISRQTSNPAMYRGRLHSIQVNIVSGAITYTDFNGELVSSIVSDTNGIKINLKRQVRGTVSFGYISSLGRQSYPNIYQRTIATDNIVVGIGNNLGSIGVPASGIADLSFIVEVYSTI